MDIRDLPSPPLGKTGWPWTEQSQPHFNSMPDGLLWPRVSIITPSFNQAQFLEETIRSVLLQNYPNLDYYLIDGGSKDSSTDIIKKYSPWLTWWVSEPDRGQAHAINKGLFRANGDLVYWINSDDYLLKDALFEIAKLSQKAQNTIILGDVVHYRQNTGVSNLIRQNRVELSGEVVTGGTKTMWQQPGTFVPLSLVRQVGGLDETLRYTFDQDWICRLLQEASVVYLHQPVAVFRVHDYSKTVSEKYLWLPEITQVARRYWDTPGLNKPELQARLELVIAAHELGANHWDRKAGRHHLHAAYSYYPQIFFGKFAYGLLARSLLPRRSLLLIRNILIKLRLHFVD